MRSSRTVLSLICSGVGILLAAGRAVSQCDCYVLKLNGYDSYVSVPNSSTLNSGQAITVEFLIKRGDSDLNGWVFSKRDDISNYGVQYGFVINSQYQRFQYQGVSGADHIYQFTQNQYSTLNDGNWHHVAFTFRWGVGSSAALYIDGQPKNGQWVAGNGGELPYTSDNAFLIGRQNRSTSPGYIDAYIDEFRLWSVYRTGEEIRSGMFSNLSGGEEGLVGYWNFDSGDARDLGPYANHGTLLGGARVVEHHLPARSYVLKLNGYDSYVSVPNSSTLNSGQAITVEFLIKRGDSDLNGWVFSKRDDISNYGVQYGFVINSQYQRFQYQGVSGADHIYQFTQNQYSTLNDGNWHHVAFTFRWGVGSSAALYIDGQPKNGQWVAGNGGELPYTSDNAFLIGRQNRSTSPGYIDAYIDEFRLWSVYRTGEEIRSGMFSNLSGGEEGLVGYWNFDSGDARDLGPYANHGTLVGGARIICGKGATAVQVRGPSTGLPRSMQLVVAYPNPFNPRTKIRFVVKKAGFASLEIFDRVGRLVRVLVPPRYVRPGSYEVVWDGRHENGMQLSSGTYFCRLRVNGRVYTGKLTLCK